jgi:glycosyltransferase involved in cell wall biosynthesis
VTRRSTIGVVVAARDASATVAEALAGVAWQRRSADEVVVVDDGSGDATADVVASWVDRLPLTVVRRAAPGGPGVARNDGIERLSTDLVVFLDADDVWLPDHLGVLETAWTDPCTVVSPTVARWWPGRYLAPWTPPAAWRVAPGEQYERLLVENFVFSGSLAACQAVRGVGGFAEGSASEDWDLWLRLAGVGHRFVLAPGPTVLYRQGLSTLSSDLQCIDGDIVVLSQVLRREPDARFRAVAERSLRDRRARQAVARSATLAGSGRSLAARMHALGGMAGRRRTRLLAAASVVAPRAVDGWRRSGVSERLRRVGR